MNKQKVNSLILLLLFLFACKNTDGTQPAPTVDLVATQAPIDSDEPSITIRFAVEDYELSGYESLIEAFTIDNPGIQIKLISAREVLGDPSARNSSEIDGRLMAQAADVFSSRYVPFFNQDQIVRDLTPLMNADPLFNPDDFYTNALQNINGRIYTLPILLNFSLIFYNKDIFDAAGMVYPQPDWTWDDFRTMANALTIRDGGTVTQWGFVKPFSSWITLIETQLSSSLIDVRTDPPTFRFEDDDVTAVAHQYETLFLADQAALAFADTTLIETGKAAMWTGSYRSYAAYTQIQNLGVITYPIAEHNTQSVTPLGVDGFVISAGSENPGAAWKWLTYLSHQGQLIDNATLPARLSTAEINQFWQNALPELGETIQAALQTSRPFITNPAYEILDDTMNAILREETDIETAFVQAQITAGQIIATTAVSEEISSPIVVNNADEETNPDIVTINFWLLNNDNIESYRALAIQFETDTNIHINFRFFDFSGGQPDLSNIAPKSDCFRWLYLRDNSYQTSVLNLDPLIAADPSFNLDDYFPLAVNKFTAQGQLWGLPADINPIIIEYNKDLFDAASIPYPTYEWTTDDFLDIAIELTTGEGQHKQYGFVPDVAESYILVRMLALSSASFIDNSMDPPTTAFTAQSTIEAMRWYTNLSAEYGVKPLFQADITNDQSTGYEEYMRLLSEEQAAMWGAHTFPILADVPETANIGAVPLPSAATNNEFDAYSMGYYISAGTLHRQACWGWIKSLTESVDVLLGVPARQSIAESAAYRQKVGEERVAAYLASLSRITTSSPSIRDADYWWMSPFDFWLARAHDQITLNNISVEDAMATAQQTFDTYRACVIEKNAFDSRKLLNQCAITVDPTLSGFLDLSEE
ncbi:MAG: extracellular solute-binding protein [Chloroflexi bacterium]|nr:extracellular solute-binding protein [Chloroflexota bacterium]